MSVDDTIARFEAAQMNREGLTLTVRETARVASELATLRQKLATAEADCAAMREVLAWIFGGGSCTAAMRMRISAALTGRPTGQAIMDELSAARKVK